MRANKITNNGEVLLDLTQDTATPETVGEGVTFHKADGSPAVGTAKLGGGAELNIAYGDTPPEDTTKLWCKTSEPSRVKIDVMYHQEESEQEGISNAGVIGTGYNLVKTCCARVGDLVYAFGGRYKSSATAAVVCSYIHTFKKKSSSRLTTTLPSAGQNMCCAAVGEKIYVFKCENSTTIYCFDTTDETVSTLGVALPVSDRLMCCAAVGTKVYIFGGYSNPTAIYCLDTETELVGTLPVTLKKAVWTAGCATVGAKVYILGGFNSTDGTLDTIQCFDTETNETYILPVKLRSGTYGAGCTAIGDKIVVWGGTSGLDSNGTNYLRNSRAQVFDTSRNLVRQHGREINSPMWSSCAPLPDDDRTVVCVGGCNSASTSTTNSQVSALVDYMWTLKLPLEIDLEEGTLFVRITASELYAKRASLINTDGLEVAAVPYYIFNGLEGGTGVQVEGLQYIDGEWQTKV